MKPPSALRGLLLAGTLLAAASSLHAAPRFWDGTDTSADADGGDGLWDITNINWDTTATGGANTTFGTGNQAVFGGTAGTVTMGNDIASGTVTGNAAGSPNGAFNCNTVDYLITGGGTTRTITTNAAIRINGNGTTFDTDVNFDLGGQLSLVNGGTCTINGAISGAHGILKAGGGTYILGGDNNSYTGQTIINQGTLAVSSIKNVGGGNSSLGAPTTTGNGTINLGAGALSATLRYTGGAQSTDRAFFLAGNAGSNGGIDMSGTGTLTLTGALTVAGGAKTLTLSGSSEGVGVFDGAIGGTGGNATSVIKNGSGTWQLTGTKVFSGSVTINEGVLEATVLQNGGASSSIGSSTNVATNLILNGGILRFTGAIGSTNRLFSLQSSSMINASGSFPLNFSNTGSIGFNGGTDAKTLTLTGTNTGNNILAAVIGDNGGATSILKSGVGTWVLSGDSPYTGATTISDGTLQIGNGDTTGELTGTSGVTNDAVLIYNRSNDFTVDYAIGGSGTLTKRGVGTMTLATANPYAGATTIIRGTLALGASGSIDDSAAVTIAAGATLDTTAKASYAIPAAQPLTFGIDATGDGSSGMITASELNIEDAVVTFDITDTPDDPVYVLATYTTLVGDNFASVPEPPSGYTLEYAYETNKIAMLQIVVATPYATWSGGAAPDEDSNGDGVANGVAWALGAADPDENAIGLLPTLDNTSDETDVLFTYLPGAAAQADENTTITVEYGTDLGGWSEAVDDGENVIIEINGGTVTVKLKRSFLAPDGRLFARFKVQIAP